MKDKLLEAIEQEKPYCQDTDFEIGYNNGLSMAKAIVIRLFGKDTNVRTNADRIRSMTDEELEAFLIAVDLDKTGSPFITEWGKWLQQPAKEGNYAN